MRRAFTLIIMTFVLTMPRTGVAQPLVFFDTVNPPFMYEYNGTVTGIYPRLIGEAFSIIGGTPKVAALPWGQTICRTHGWPGLRRRSLLHPRT